MASSLAYPRIPGAPLGTAVTVSPGAYTTTQCPPPCPACGGLECLCRPRFFPGQVLTDDDLNRLENYVIAKNRLHNRYFHGPGVVCGLEVVCDPCNSGNVTVNPGYALSPCGDDIIVCNAASVSICDLINQCKPRQDNCDPYSFQQPIDCKQGVQTWVLSICYQENPSRGVQPLMSEPCACKCKGGCGGACGCSGSCGCGGGSTTSVAGGCGCKTTVPSSVQSSSASAAKYNPQCEPTLICEGFSFTATRYIDPKTQQGTDLSRYGPLAVLAAKAAQLGPLLSRLLCCYLRAVQIRDAFANQQYSNDPNDLQLTLAYSEFSSALRDFAAEHVAHRCDLARQIACLDLANGTGAQAPGAAPQAVGAAAALAGAAPPVGVALPQLNPAALWQARFERLNALWLEVFRECFCSVPLPPCIDVTGGNCIPLAVVTINADTCAVIDICNWTQREFALTLPTLYYWTSFVNWGAIKDVIAQLCCGQTDSRTWAIILQVLAAIIKNNSAVLPAAAPAAAAPAAGALRNAAAAPAAPAPGPTPAAATLLALNGFVQQASMPDGMARLLNVAQGSPAGAAPDTSGLQAAVADLQKTVTAQSAQIAKLMRGK